MLHSTNILADKNNETWLAVEGNVIHVFTTKSAVVQYRTENHEVNVLHRYSDGSLEPLMFWGNQEVIATELPLMDFIEAEYYSESEEGYDEELDFYDLAAANDVAPEIKE